MKKFKVIIDGDEVIENVVGWSTPGGRLLELEFADGTIQLVAGFVGAIIKVTGDSNVTK